MRQATPRLPAGCMGLSNHIQRTCSILRKSCLLRILPLDDTLDWLNRYCGNERFHKRYAKVTLKKKFFEVLFE